MKDNQFYTNERAQQILIEVLKANNIKKVVASPGTASMSLIVSMEHDGAFEMYSSIDERSAAYMACGLSAESGEPVVLVCTEATASRNYGPGLTEAFYRKLPILAVTGSHGEHLIGQLVPQVIDRRTIANDVANLDVRVHMVKDKGDEWLTTLRINQAVLELKRRGGGPVHLDIETHGGKDYSVKEIAPVKIIRRYTTKDQLPALPKGTVGVFIGAHTPFSKEETTILDQFCSANDAVVFCDQTSNYFGKYRVNYSIVASQEKYISSKKNLGLIIHIGEVSGEYWRVSSRQTWRVNEDGEIRDSFRGSLTSVFEMTEMDFFKSYIPLSYDVKENLLIQYKEEISHLTKNIPELPFSNTWIAQILHNKIPSDSYLHFAILNSLRAWNFFDTPQAIMTSCNVGGFGIDGCLSTLLGASLAHPDKLHFAFIGDLAFFYDMNALGNRHLGNNLRILLVNNGKGTEFRLYWHPAAQFGDEADHYVAAGGHFGDKSPNVVKSYVEALGFEYISASNKEEFMHQYEHFVAQEMYDRPIVFEVFTSSDDENAAVHEIRNAVEDEGYKSRRLKTLAKKPVKTVIQGVKKIIS